ncbi:hypothetical protein [Burkholderia contaminans]|uniref:hypothetical protein n=1 Tax=Burkholderia contaminans TaxID=488447 RepID=UPI0008F4C22C|nr:hypothetical protein [Burkholderia contaminans]
MLHRLTKGAVLNNHVRQFFTVMGKVIEADDYVARSVSATLTGDSGAISITSPHGIVVGMAEHVRRDEDIVARLTFSAIRTEPDGKKTASEIMTAVIEGDGYISEINGTESRAGLGTDYAGDEAVYFITSLLLSCQQDKLPTLSSSHAL